MEVNPRPLHAGNGATPVEVQNASEESKASQPQGNGETEVDTPVALAALAAL